MLVDATIWNTIYFLLSFIVLLAFPLNTGHIVEKMRLLNAAADENGDNGTWNSKDQNHNNNNSSNSNNNNNSNGNNTITNITVQLGVTAYLHCHVINDGDTDKDSVHVSWIRRRDWHILSSGLMTYTNDERFQILHQEGAHDWTLQIKYVQKRDNGTYVCQVSSRNGLISHFVNLQTVVPEAFILGTGERHVDVGSIIDLICIIDKSPVPPQYVFWYHNDRMINYDMSRSGIHVETSPGVRTESRLTIRDTHDIDSGNYTCSASNTESASIYVFVEEGDKMASLRRKSTAMKLQCHNLLINSILSITLFIVVLL